MRDKDDLWYWYRNVSECCYHIQITVKHRKALMKKGIEGVILNAMRGFKERYAVEIQHVGFDRKHIHVLRRFLPKYSGGQVIRLIKSITAQQVFREIREVKKVIMGRRVLDRRPALLSLFFVSSGSVKLNAPVG